MNDRAAQLLLRLIAITSFVLLAGCGTKGTVRGAFDDLTYDGSRNKTSFVSYHSTLSLSGLIPPHAPGMSFFEPDGVGLGMLPPSLLYAKSPVDSFAIETKYQLASTEDGAKIVLDVRNKYLDVREKAVGVASARAAVAVANMALKMANDKEINDGLFAKALAVLKIKKSESTEKDKAKIDDKANIAARLLDSEAALVEAQKALQIAMTALTQSINKPNLIVTRWAREDNASATGDVGSYATTTAENQERTNGILVLADIRVRSVVLGKDFYSFLNKLQEENPLITAIKLKNLGIVTYAIEAKHVAYISERDYLAAAALSLGVTKDQLMSLLEDETKVEIAAALSTAANLSNTGVISNPVTAVQDYSFMDEVSHLGFIKSGINASNGYSTIYAVRATVEWPMLAVFGPPGSKDKDKNSAATPSTVAPVATSQ